MRLEVYKFAEVLIKRGEKKQKAIRGLICLKGETVVSLLLYADYRKLGFLLSFFRFPSLHPFLELLYNFLTS